ncbi:LOW QUALITY PROTEIN: hypothetical protein M8C21_008788 [Ambrosia artemisiifolia]|uniref:Uncharacterized protein n=1 Tax=Ambrosia artemisiifolia TaxID=4212 RepID=A0AAD5BVR0_AMBAR|nr:LOW QUALITY PROTEIN: hypothetical protein M8C21_008788 [Ambrosia artemisiifolia]
MKTHMLKSGPMLDRLIAHSYGSATLEVGEREASLAFRTIHNPHLPFKPVDGGKVGIGVVGGGWEVDGTVDTNSDKRKEVTKAERFYLQQLSKDDSLLNKKI